jgi:hypothetical protein
MNVTYRLLVYADDVDLPGINKDTRRRNKPSCVNILQDKTMTYWQIINSQIYGSGPNKSKPRHTYKYLETKVTNPHGIRSRRNKYHKEFGECLLPFGSQSYVFPFDI